MNEDGTYRVLIAAHDSNLLHCWHETLQDENCRIEEARSGHDLLERLLGGESRAAREPDVVLAQLRMPGPSGFEVLGELRSRGQEVPFILFAPCRDDKTNAVAGALGADAVLHEPLDPRGLKEIVQHFLSRPDRRSRQSRASQECS